ncbi:putative WAS/WASL-interacting protein family member 3-like [Cocos nucifera]|uniref:Putative WAS/WASL-interacting protein family member 3-like n=1 Tax=Cocos nucifera TaxID=13894 RepID=A0A8K0IH32_COCNU|nr:putative WAS/WASL-interacting protein family member 3-like [Cocos nucifera]
MVLRFSEIDKTKKPPPAAATAGPSFSVPFKNPTLRWGSTRRMRCHPVSDRRGPDDLHPPPPTSHQTRNDPSTSCGRFSVPFKNPALWWGSTRRMCCQPVSDHRDPTDRRPSSASPSPPPTSHQTKNDPTPPPGRPRLVIRIPCRTQAKDPEIDGPPAPEERRDHHQETRKAATGAAPLEIARPVAGPVTRTLRSRAGSQGEEKTVKKVRPAEFSISLSHEEIMEDFIAMTAAKPPRRPKKRPRLLEKNLNGIFPGSELPKIITAGLYSLR